MDELKKHVCSEMFLRSKSCTLAAIEWGEDRGRELATYSSPPVVETFELAFKLWVGHTTVDESCHEIRLLPRQEIFAFG